MAADDAKAAGTRRQDRSRELLQRLGEAVRHEGADILIRLGYDAYDAGILRNTSAVQTGTEQKQGVEETKGGRRTR